MGDRLVAVRAEPARPDSTAKAIAVLATAGAEVSLLTRRALVDGVVGDGDGGDGCVVGVACPPVGLLAGVGAEAPPP